MRMPWTKSKGEQLDLLDSGPCIEDLAEPATRPPSPPPGLAFVVATSALDEDPGNPRTELPQDELADLAENIKQRGILQPIVVHPADAAGRYRIHFGARRWRAAQLAGLATVPIVVRDAPADPYAQVAENQKRHGLTPMDLARFIRGRIDQGETNSEVARRLGMNLTTVAHHLALLDLPPVLDEAMQAGRCTSPRTLHELGKLHDDDPEKVESLLASGAEITRAKVAKLRASAHTPSTQDACASPPAKLIAQAQAACDRFEHALQRLDLTGTGMGASPEVAALRARIDTIAQRWLQGSDRQTPPQAGR